MRSVVTPVVFKKKCDVEKYGTDPVRYVAYIRDDITESMCEISVSIREMFSAGVRDEMNSLMDIYRLRLQCTAKYGADTKGEFTFVIQAGKSVIDYDLAPIYY
jgi:hypothetical protein